MGDEPAGNGVDENVPWIVDTLESPFEIGQGISHNHSKAVKVLK